MPNGNIDPALEAAGSWAKKYFLASRALMDEVLRPFDLGGTQWYVLSLLARDGDLRQRDMTSVLEVERATLSPIISTLVRKGLVEQQPDPDDQRQKVLHITSAGVAACAAIPDPVELITSVAFSSVTDADIATTLRVLKEATQRLTAYKKESQP